MSRINDMLIESVVRKVLLEYSGVSDDVTNVSDKLYYTFTKFYNSTPWKESELEKGMFTKFYKRTFTTGLEKAYVKGLIDELVIRLFAYDPSQTSFSEAFGDYSSMGLVNVGYSPSSKRISVMIPWAKDNSDKDCRNYLMLCFNHELKHALTYTKRGNTEISDSYQKASNFHSDNATLFQYYIKDLYYFCDLDEIDAYLQELYIELTQGNKLESCKSYQMYKKRLKEFKWINDRIYNPLQSLKDMYQKDAEGFQQILSSVLGDGVTPKMFYQYCQRGFKRYDEHMKRIIGRYNSEEGTPRGSFKQYAQGEIPQQQLQWRKKPSMVDKLKGMLRRGRN